VIRKEPDPAKRKAQWDEVQKRFYEYVPAIRYGDNFGFRAMQTSVKGFNENMSFYASTTCGWRSNRAANGGRSRGAWKKGA
jgi:ABC-type transport system substrate-binding protein